MVSDKKKGQTKSKSQEKRTANALPPNSNLRVRRRELNRGKIGA